MGGPVPNPFKSKPKAQEQPQVPAQMEAPKPATVADTLSLGYRSLLG